MSEKYLTVGQRVSYGVGRQMADQLKAQPFDGIDPQAVADGVIDALSDKDSAISQNDLQAAFAEINEIMQAKLAAEGELAAKVGQDFLVENAKLENITVLESGLQYEIMSEGDGEKPVASSTVKTHYHGTLINGYVFDSSVARDEPAQFPVNGVIAGWTEALQLMPVGSKWRLFIPSELAYGEAGAGADIGPHQALIFEVELLEIVS